MLLLFVLTALGQLTLALVVLAALVRYRSLMPRVFLALLGEHLVRRLIVWSYRTTAAADPSFGRYLNLGILDLMALGLALSLILSRKLRPTRSKADLSRGFLSPPEV